MMLPPYPPSYKIITLWEVITQSNYTIERLHKAVSMSQQNDNDSIPEEECYAISPRWRPLQIAEWNDAAQRLIQIPPIVERYFPGETSEEEEENGPGQQ